jgi:hypothetical protein
MLQRNGYEEPMKPRKPQTIIRRPDPKQSPGPAQQATVEHKEEPPKRDPLAMLIGLDIVVQNRSGVIFKGTLIEIVKGFLRLKDVTIMGPKYEVTDLEWCLVDRSSIGHIHPAVGNIDFSE